MSVEFIEKGYNQSYIKEASIQEDQLSYFTESKLQDNTLNDAYFQEWANRKYQTSDYFHNWIKSIFKESNFLKAFKYMRYPLPSARLVKNRIEPQLKRVFKAEDSEYKYDVTGKTTEDFIQDLNIKEFNEELFSRLMYNHNSIVIEDLDTQNINTPYRYFIDIRNVVSLLYKNNQITKISFHGSIEYEGEEIDGFVYIDNKEYAFYDKDKVLVSSVTHDLGRCPASFIAKDKYKNNFIVRQSLFTFIREELEEYTFLKTLQRMCEASGVIPVVSKLEVDYEDGEDNETTDEISSDSIMSSQTPSVNSNNNHIGTGDLEPGTVHEIPQDGLKDNEGNINMDVVKSFLNFHYTPVEPIRYIDERIKSLEKSIITTIVGDVVSANEESKNQQQIEKSISVLEDTLTSFASTIDAIRKVSDTNMLGLKYGMKLINSVFIHTGTDFFLESQSMLFDELSKAPNSLERRKVVDRINKNKYKNNTDQLSRQTILYKLIPYVSDVDFDKAIAREIDSVTFQYQTRFDYWVTLFESNFGDIVSFYQETEISDNQKITVINNLIIELINIELSKTQQTNTEDENIKDQDEKDFKP